MSLTSTLAAAATIALGLVVAGDVAKPPSEKVEEVDLDALEDDKPAPTTAPAAGSTKEEEVDLAKLDEGPLVVEYDTRPWLLVLPVLCLLIVAWNVDWREARVKAEIVARRAKRAPPPKKGSAA